MPWFKVDDSFHDHPKVLEASDAAVALWVRAGTWSARNLMNGFVPSALLARVGGDRDSAEELVHCGLWERSRGGYQFHDWSDYQPDAEEERVKREQKREAGRKGGVNSGKSRSKTGSRNEAAASGSAWQADEAPNPNPTQGKKQKTQASSAKKATRIPDDFQVTPEMVEWARERVPHIDGRRETEKFINHWQSKAGKDAAKVDWVKTWKNWMLNAAERAPNRQQRSSQHQTDANIAQLLGNDTQPQLRAIPGGDT